MKITFDWLKEHLKINSKEKDLLEQLTNIGLEIESVEDKSEDFKYFTVAKVIKAEKHPDADKLRVCKVDTDNGEVQIICGAPNVKEGIKVPYSLFGTNLYNDNNECFMILLSKIRVEISEGMICSEKELQLGESHEGIMVLDEINPIGKKCSEIFEIYIDNLIEIEAPDKPLAT